MPPRRVQIFRRRILLEQHRVGFLRGLGTFRVAYEPEERHQNVCHATDSEVDTPHGRGHTLEPSEEHRGCQMNGLAGLCSVSPGCPACAENSQKPRGQLELHGFRHKKQAIFIMKAPLERIRQVLGAVTCNIQDRGGWYMLEHLPAAEDLHNLG
jgi:hypothetical protein